MWLWDCEIMADRPHGGHLLTAPNRHLRLNVVLTTILAAMWLTQGIVHIWWKTACLLSKRRINGNCLHSGWRAIWWRECMMWGGVCSQERTPLDIINGNLTARLYIVDILLHPTVAPFFQQQPFISAWHRTVLTHGPNGHLPWGPTSIGNMLMCVC